MASIYHLCNMRPIQQNHYPNHLKSRSAHADHKVFGMKHKSKLSYPNFKNPHIFKSRTILPFIGKKLLIKAQKDSHPGSFSESATCGGISGTRNIGSRVLFYLSEKARHYVSLTRVLRDGSWLLTGPSWWAIGLAADPGAIADVKMLALFGVLGVLTNGIACTINDYLDRDIDAKVERTKSRPLVSGIVTPFEALCLLGFLLLLSFGLLLRVNILSCILWSLSMLLIFSYPLMKRFTYWAQGYIGLAVNFSALYGWSAIKGSLDGHILLPLYISGACLTLAYDTIYAYQDKEDDEKIGLKSTAILFGNFTKEWIAGIAAACVGGFTLTGFLANIGWPYYAFLAAASAQFAWLIWTVDLSSPSDCGKTSQTCSIFGALLLFGILFGRLYQ